MFALQLRQPHQSLIQSSVPLVQRRCSNIHDDRPNKSLWRTREQRRNIRSQPRSSNFGGKAIQNILASGSNDEDEMVIGHLNNPETFETFKGPHKWPHFSLHPFNDVGSNWGGKMKMVNNCIDERELIRATF